MRESIKQLLFNDISLNKSYKGEINDWYTDFKIYKVVDRYNNKVKYYSGYEQFDDIDKAIEHFMINCFTSKNKGYIQQRLDEKYDLEKKYDLENPSKELIELFEIEGKLVDEEYKLMK